MIQQDTIAAIATPLGPGGVGVIRVSGANAENIARNIFKSRRELLSFKSHHLYRGDIVSPVSGIVLDEALVSLMKAPHSYTGEDVLEIHCHGGVFILHSVLEAVVAAGCRLAGPGEFTQRAFLNDRLDLAQAEAVGDLIMANSERGRALAISQLKGSLTARAAEIRENILSAIVLLEASIDFSSEEVSLSSHSGLSDDHALLDGVIQELHNLLATYARGKIFRNGANVVLIGKPNVGKSSILNALLGETRAIVTPVPGTTRDFIEELIDIKGTPIRLTDTAGIRSSSDIIEQAGIALVRERVAEADLAVMIMDASTGITAEDHEIAASLSSVPCLAVINKVDLLTEIDAVFDLKEVMRVTDSPVVAAISAKYGTGFNELREEIHHAVLGRNDDRQGEIIIASLRHKDILEKTLFFLLQAREGMRSQQPSELIAIELRDALLCLGELTAKTTDSEILDQIFSRFCIGK